MNSVMLWTGICLVVVLISAGSIAMWVMDARRANRVAHDPERTDGRRHVRHRRPRQA